MARPRSLRKWHRWLGVASALFLIWLAVSGLILNHAASLRLNEIRLEQSWLLALYGRDGAVDDATAFDLHGTSVSWAGRRLFLDGEPVADNVERPVAAVRGENLIVVAGERQISLLAPGAGLLETFSPSGLPGRIAAMGTAGNRIVARTAGGRMFSADENAGRWTPFEGDVVWQNGGSASSDVQRAMARHLGGGDIPLHRVLLDAHSGRLLGLGGVLGMDLVAVLLLVLSVTGLWIWWPRR
ncbi:MAG: PepSY domain-containing protein [Parvibaculaceae bacterium]